MTRVLGVDGCRAGWIAVVLEMEPDGAVRVRWRPVTRLNELLELRPRFVALDMPIGLAARREPGGRECDRLARARLGPRRSSVFTPPTRDLLGSTEYEEVRRRGLSVQSFHLLPKIREVDSMIDPMVQRRWRETHPELAFAHLRGAPMAHPKRSAEGRAERLEALRSAVDLLPAAESLYREGLGLTRRRDVAHDDLLDAMALATAARRMLEGRAERLPARPPKDARGLRMEIWG